MNRLRRLDRRKKNGFRPGSIYGQDPGDTSVEHSYLQVQEEVRRGIAAMRTYHNEGPREKERFLANAVAPRSRTLRTLLTVIFALYGVGKGPGEQGTIKEQA